MSEQAFQAVASFLMAIAPNDVKSPDIPVSEYADEGETLSKWAATDLDALKKAGLDVTLIDNLPVRANALRYQQAQWMADTEGRKNALQEWKDTSPTGFDLVAQLQHTMRFAFRNQPVLLSRLDEIALDAGNADMVQDLLSLSVLGSKNKALLEAVAFDLTQLDTAAQLATTLGNLLAMNNGSQDSNSEIKQMRDRAYTYLKMAVDEVRQYGKFVFWRTPDRLNGYASDYLRKLTSKSTQKNKSVAPEA